MNTSNYRVIACNGRREKVVASGLTQEDAQAMKERISGAVSRCA